MKRKISVLAAVLLAIGITLIPFCTSGGSGIGRSGQNLADNAGSGTWLEGKRFGGGVSEDELRSWIDGLQ